MYELSFLFFFTFQAFEKDTKLDVWKVYKEALQDHKSFLNCWDSIVGDLKNQSYPPTTDTKRQFEEFSSTITGLWSMVEWDGTKCNFQGEWNVTITFVIFLFVRCANRKM